MRLGGFDSSLRCLHLCDRRQVVLIGVVDFLLRHRLLLCERGVAVGIELRAVLIRFGTAQIGTRLDQARLGLRELSVGLGKLAQGLIDGCLKRAGIDLKEHLVFPDEGALDVILP